MTNSFCLFTPFVCPLVVVDRSAELKKFRAVQAEAEKEIEKYKHEKLRKAKDREDEKKQVSESVTMNIITQLVDDGRNIDTSFPQEFTIGG